MHKEATMGFRIRMLHNLIRETIDKSRPDELGIKLTQLQAGIMGYLFHHQDQMIYQKDIEEEFHVSRATATNTLKVMEKNKLITRKAMDQDGRLKRINMTPQAKENHLRVEKHMSDMDEHMLQGLTAQEIQEFKDTIEKISRNLREYGKEIEQANAENIRKTN